ncbi:hypothetical protein SUGI_0995600 [Cryptomeria japonica]|nr:hypothetical protein SUGI_0995600 [Cryptomeria japonica]
MGFKCLILRVEQFDTTKDEFWPYIEEVHHAQNEENENEFRSLERVNISHPSRSPAPPMIERKFFYVSEIFEMKHAPNIFNQAPTSIDTYVVLCSNPSPATAPRPRPVDMDEEATDVTMAQTAQEDYQEQYRLSLGRDMHNNDSLPLDHFIGHRPNCSLYPYAGFYIQPLNRYRGFYTPTFYPCGHFSPL